MIGIYNSKSGKSKEYVTKYAKILDHNRIAYKFIDYNNHFFDELKECTYYIHRFVGTDDAIYIARTLLPLAEFHLGIKCFPDFKTYWPYEDKIKESLLSEIYNLPMAKSFVFFNLISAKEWINSNDKYPLIFKLRSGAGSINVVKVNNKKEAIKLTKKMFTSGLKSEGIPSFGNLKYFNPYNLMKYYGIKLLSMLNLYTSWNIWNKHKMYVLFQEFLPNNDFDTRVTIIGDRAFAFRRFNRKKDFRSSGSGLIDYNIESIDLVFIKTAFHVSRKLGFQTMAYDFLKDQMGNPVLCEFSYTFKDQSLYDCPGYWDSNLNFIEGHFWPQYFQLIDLLEISDLKQPQDL
jgi:glutathione synthase/RimK-type ligase-like ATP-grasp enzyme